MVEGEHLQTEILEDFLLPIKFSATHPLKLFSHDYICLMKFPRPAKILYKSLTVHSYSTPLLVTCKSEHFKYLCTKHLYIQP